MDQAPCNVTRTKILAIAKPRIKPFYIEFDENWTDLVIKSTEINKEKPTIDLKGERLIVLYKTDDDFRETQRWLDINSKHYTTLHPKYQCRKKICIRGLPCCTETNLIVNRLKEHGFTVTRATILKNRKTGSPSPLCMVNVLPRKNFEEIYQIQVIQYISVKIEAFKSFSLLNNAKDARGFGTFWRYAISRLNVSSVQINI